METEPRVGPSRVAGSTAREHVLPAADGSVFLPVLRWPGLAPWRWHRPATAAANAVTWIRPCAMCPSYRAHRREAATPRSQANLVRQIATGQVDPKLWGSEEFKANAGLCIHCKLCLPECPAGVDVSSLMLEAKSAFVENHGLPPGDWVFSRLEMWARLASRFPIISNFLMSRRNARWLIERMLGVSRHRVLPRVRRTPLCAGPSGWGSPGRGRTSLARAWSTSSTSTPITMIMSLPSRSWPYCTMPRSMCSCLHASAAPAWRPDRRRHRLRA